MSELTLFKGGVPAFLKGAELDETTKSLMGTGAGGKRISIKGNIFRMISNGEEVATNEDRAMSIVIVRASPHTSRTFYKGTYKEGGKETPSCWSADGVAPSAACPEKQSAKCADCDQNVKGSGQDNSKACRYSRKLAVVLDGDMGGDVYELSLPATSLFGRGEAGKLPLEAYVRHLASHNVPVTAVVTEMRFDTKSPVPKLTFKAERGLTESEWETCRAQSETDDAAKAVEHAFTIKAKDDTGTEPVATKPKAAKPKPVVAEEDDEGEEPTKVESKKAAAPVAGKTAINDLLDEWAND